MIVFDFGKIVFAVKIVVNVLVESVIADFFKIFIKVLEDYVLNAVFEQCCIIGFIFRQ